MTKTFAEILAQYEESSPHDFVPGCKAVYCIKDGENSGYELMQVTNGVRIEMDASSEIEKPELDDLVIEL